MGDGFRFGISVDDMGAEYRLEEFSEESLEPAARLHGQGFEDSSSTDSSDASSTSSESFRPADPHPPMRPVFYSASSDSSEASSTSSDSSEASSTSSRSRSRSQTTVGRSFHQMLMGMASSPPRRLPNHPNRAIPPPGGFPSQIIDTGADHDEDESNVEERLRRALESDGLESPDEGLIRFLIESGDAEEILQRHGNGRGSWRGSLRGRGSVDPTAIRGGHRGPTVIRGVPVESRGGRGGHGSRGGRDGRRGPISVAPDMESRLRAAVLQEHGPTTDSDDERGREDYIQRMLRNPSRAAQYIESHHH